jgi:hypothetical protein
MDCFFFKQAVTKYEKLQVAKHWENVRKEMAREKNSRPEFFEPLPLHEA